MCLAVTTRICAAAIPWRAPLPLRDPRLSKEFPKRDQARAFFDQTLNFCNDAGFSPTIRCEAGTVFGVLNMVAAGVGVAIVPASCASAAGPDIVMRRLAAIPREGALLLVTRRGDRDPASPCW